MGECLFTSPSRKPLVKIKRFIIGALTEQIGAVYKAFLPFANKFELTKVHRNYEGDVFFPNINWDNWNLINEEKGVSEKDGIPFSFLTYIKNI